MENTQKTAKVTRKVASHTVKSCKIVLEGTIVSFDAKLMSAAREEGTGLKMVVKTDTGAIVPASQIYTANGKTYLPADVGRALEQGDGSYLWIEKEEIDSCKSSTNDKEIKITKFIPMNQVDAVMFDSSYFVAADPGKLKRGAAPDPNCQNSLFYSTLIGVMKNIGLVAQTKIDFKGKEHNAIIRVYTDTEGVNFLMLHTIYTSTDIRTANVIRPTVKIDALIEQCMGVVNSMVQDFNPSEITSESDAKFNALIERKHAEMTGVATPTTTSSTASAGDDLVAKFAASLLQVNLKKAAETETTAEKVKA